MVDLNGSYRSFSPDKEIHLLPENRALFAASPKGWPLSGASIS